MGIRADALVSPRSIIGSKTMLPFSPRLTRFEVIIQVLDWAPRAWLRLKLLSK